MRKTAAVKDKVTARRPRGISQSPESSLLAYTMGLCSVIVVGITICLFCHDTQRALFPIWEDYTHTHKDTHLEVRVLKLLWDSRGCNRRWEEKVWRYSACVCVFDESLKAECNVFVRRIVYLVISISIIVELVPEWVVDHLTSHRVFYANTPYSLCSLHTLQLYPCYLNSVISAYYFYVRTRC